ncbi:MAG: FxsA family protein [Pseudomonadota bacterium]|uniref:FxsA family protein n=1 Tax=Roseovarius TaxID=74030 RepID=UPI0022A7AFB4|nr:FxsA family protein [Roseovarius sp. EGI FJ00037]MCZ0811278.1 FxsA family protein [Roseovarius sp. EGI FJ00037]
MWLFLAFLSVPLIEIALFIQVGGAIGLWPTLGIVVLTAILGTFLVRNQGLMAMGKLRRSFSELDDPTEPLAHGAMILVAGALLLTPGFFTDAVGFALLMPPVRRAAFDYLRKRVHVQRFEMGPDGPQGPRRPRDPGVIEGDYQEVDPANSSERPGRSGWTTRH